MEIDTLREYIVLSQTLNYTKAANELHVTQPTLSRHISAMEKELGCELLMRDKHRVDLTDAGNFFASAAMQIVETYDMAQTKISEMVSRDPVRVCGTVSDSMVSAITSIAATLLDAEGQPPVVYDYSTEGTYVDRIVDGKCDIAFMFLDERRLEEFDLAYIPLTRSQFSAVVHMSSPLAGRKSVSIDDLRNCRFIKFADNYAINGWMNIEHVCKNHGYTPQTRTVLGRNTINYTATPIAPQDVMILQSSMAQLRYLSDFSNVSVMPVTDEDAVFKLFAVYKRQNEPRVRQTLEAYTKAKKIIQSHGNTLLVETAQ